MVQMARCDVRPRMPAALLADELKNGIPEETTCFHPSCLHPCAVSLASSSSSSFFFFFFLLRGMWINI